MFSYTEGLLSFRYFVDIGHMMDDTLHDLDEMLPSLIWHLVLHTTKLKKQKFFQSWQVMASINVREIEE